MKAVEFVFRNPDSTDPFYQQSLRLGICPHCDYNETCQSRDEMPVMSALSRYIMRWYSEQKTVPSYPLPGTWEDQPWWFTVLIAACANKYNQLENERMQGNG